MVNTMQKFVDETDFHGWNHVLKRDSPRLVRVFWLLVVLGATSVFIYLVAQSFDLYFSRRYSYHSNFAEEYERNVSLPEVSICFFPAKVVLPPGKSRIFSLNAAVWHESSGVISDTDAIIYAERLFDTTLSIKPVGNNLRHKIDVDAIDNLNTNTYTTRKYKKGWLTDAHIDMLVLRLKNIPPDMTWLADEAMTNFALKHGIHPNHVTFCNYHAEHAERVTTCENLPWTYSLTFEAYQGNSSTLKNCMHLENLIFNFDTTNAGGVDPEEQFLEILFQNAIWIDEFMFYEISRNDERLSKRYFPYQVSWTVTLKHRSVIKRLSTPYHSKACFSREVRFACKHQCVKEWEKRYNCTLQHKWLFNESSGLQPGDLCQLDNTYMYYIDKEYVDTFLLSYHRCLHHCPDSCEKHKMIVLAEQTEEYEYYPFLRIQSTDIIHTNVVEEIPTYDFLDILSNLGGLMGLLTGASLITLIHLGYYMINYMLAMIAEPTGTPRRSRIKVGGIR